MFKKVGLQFKISLLILSIFFAMIIVSSIVNIILVNNVNRKKVNIILVNNVNRKNLWTI